MKFDGNYKSIYQKTISKNKAQQTTSIKNITQRSFIITFVQNQREKKSLKETWGKIRDVQRDKDECSFPVEAMKWKHSEATTL